MKLNLGCGRNTLEGWVNIDKAALPGVDHIADMENLRLRELILDSSVDEFLLSHSIEHVRDTLSLMQELHRMAKPDALLTARVPYGSSDDAWEDPTHVRPYFLKSWKFFGQPYYWRGDYGYRGDWRVEQVILLVDKSFNHGSDVAEEALLSRIHLERNVVQEMIAILRAIKPVREARRDLQETITVSFAYA